VTAAAARILNRVRREGDAALRALTEEFDHARVGDFRVSEAEIEAAFAEVDDGFLTALRAAIEAVRVFHSRHLPSEEAVETAPGVRVWRVWRAIDEVGLYVPGGRARYPSSVVMLAVPAAIAGCRRRVLVTPPDREGRVPAATLVAAAQCGVTEIYRVGGAQAVGALAYGTETIAPVSKIFGPGNAYVTAAKLAVYPDVAIDVPAGPSELMIISDDSGDPEWIAADLLADAEHGPDSPVVLVTTSAFLASSVMAEVERQLADLPRAALARQSLENYGAAVIVDSVTEAIAVANDYAPEHLQIMTRNASDLVPLVQNAGSVFVGHWSPNAAGDYATGTNHVLPTSGYARASAALSTEAFGRAMQVQELDRRGISALSTTVSMLARSEGLEGHARAVEVRARRPVGREARLKE
jgi:histidinol dehydrogenase